MASYRDVADDFEAAIAAVGTLRRLIDDAVMRAVAESSTGNVNTTRPIARSGPRRSSPGLRLGEVRALRWEDVDFASGLIRVRRSWDPKAGEVEPKSAKGRRDVPLIARLRDVLTEHSASCRWTRGLAFGIGSATPFNLTGFYGRSRREWTAAGLDVIGPHDARHTYASFLIAAGADFKVIQEAMGHASITTTIDLYGHLLPGAHAVTAGKLDALLKRADTASRVAQLGALPN